MNIEKIKCAVCGKEIGTWDTETGELQQKAGDYNSCDHCGKEICYACSFSFYDGKYVEEFNGCQKCFESHKTIDAWLSRAEELGFEIVEIHGNLDCSRQDPLWYGGTMFKATYRGFTVEVKTVGDVCAELYRNGEIVADVRDKNNTGEFAYTIGLELEDDEDIEHQENELFETNWKNGLFVSNNNSYEVFIEKSTPPRLNLSNIECWEYGDMVCLSDYFGPMFSFGDIFDFAGYKQIIDEFEKEQKQTEDNSSNEVNVISEIDACLDLLKIHGVNARKLVTEKLEALKAALTKSAPKEEQK